MPNQVSTCPPNSKRSFDDGFKLKYENRFVLNMLCDLAINAWRGWQAVEVEPYVRDKQLTMEQLRWLLQRRTPKYADFVYELGAAIVARHRKQVPVSAETQSVHDDTRRESWRLRGGSATTLSSIKWKRKTGPSGIGKSNSTIMIC